MIPHTRFRPSLSYNLILASIRCKSLIVFLVSIIYSTVKYHEPQRLRRRPRRGRSRISGVRECEGLVFRPREECLGPKITGVALAPRVFSIMLATSSVSLVTLLYDVHTYIHTFSPLLVGILYLSLRRFKFFRSGCMLRSVGRAES